MRPDFQMKMLRMTILSLLLSVGIMGVSYSLYTQRTDIRSRLAMGGMDVVFTDVHLEDDGTSAQPPAMADIVNGGKNIAITLCDAHPGDTACFTYELQNNGTVPVVYELDDGGGFLTVYPQSDRLEAGGGTGTGMIRIRVGDGMAPGESYSLSVVLNFQQVNAVERQILF